MSAALHNARLFQAMGKDRAELSRILHHSSDGILSTDAEGRSLLTHLGMPFRQPPPTIPGTTPAGAA